MFRTSQAKHRVAERTIASLTLKVRLLEMELKHQLESNQALSEELSCTDFNAQMLYAELEQRDRKIRRLESEGFIVVDE
jgi:hypothetical protein